jgi:CubicO group peptidase (beta-lactamase class C family)
LVKIGKDLSISTSVNTSIPTKSRSLLLRSTAVAILLSIACVAAVTPQETATISQILAGTMRPGVEAATFSHSDQWYPSTRVPRKGPVRPLPMASKQLDNVHFQSNGKNYDLFDYLADNRIAGLLVLKDGKIALEDYELGITPATLWASFSMAKSVSSTLVGAALQQGLITSLDDPIARYVPALKGGGYEGVSVRSLLQMASGVQWNETYTDPQSDVSKLGLQLLTKKPGTVVTYMKALPKAGPPGSIWNYSTGETYLVGAVIEGATHKPLAAFLAETLWSRLGMEHDATWWLESPGGMGLAGAGIGATLRDYGRFGFFVQQDGRLDGKRIVPEGWFREAGSAHVIGAKSIDYGYLWWPLPAGDPVHTGAFEARGIYGQHIYINPTEKLVIVLLSARPKPTGATVLDDAAFFASVARSLQ